MTTAKKTGLATRHRLYDKAARKWRKVRDAVEGGDAIRDCATEYLPRLKDQTAEEYTAYYSRPAFFEATGRTKEAMSGLAFARSPIKELPPQVEEHETDIDLKGNSLTKYATQVTDEVFDTGRLFVVVNHNGDVNNPGTLADQSGRPYLRHYTAEAIFDWRERTRNGVAELSYVKVREIRELPGPDEFSTTCEEVFRIFDFDEAGNYRQRVLKEETRTFNGQQHTGIVVLEQFTPIVNGFPWRSIPGVMLSLNGELDPGPVPLYPIADTNIAHWRNSADLEHGAHFTALPTPVFSGVDMQGKSIRIGSQTGINLADPAAKAYFLEFTGSGLGVLREMITHKESQMAALGARMLAPERAQVESGVALAIRHGGENGALLRVCNAVSAGLTKALQLFATWNGGDPDKVSYKLNPQLADDKIDPATISALLAAYQAGGISKETFIDNLARGGRLPEGRTVEDEKEAIESEPPPLGTMDDDAEDDDEGEAA